MMRTEKGFSMLELLVSTVIFSIGVLSLAQVFVLGVNSIHRTKFQTRATNIAREMMEEIQSKSFDETMVGQDPTAQRDTSSFTKYKTMGDTTSGFPLDTGESSTNRTTFDDIDDYAKYKEEPSSVDTKFNTSVKVVYAQDSNLNGPAKTSRSNYKRITINVTSKTYNRNITYSTVSYYRGM